MPLITLYSTEDGIERLLAQPLDLDGAALIASSKDQAQATADHTGLFQAYRADLNTAYNIAVAWWEDTITAQEKVGKSRNDAIEESFDRRMAGAASHPKVVWIVRAYWLQCVTVNANLPAADRIRPEILLLRWLIDAKEAELVRLLACMPYWPMGLDENGNWC